MKRIIILLLLSIIIPSCFAANKCSAELQNKPGTCVNQLYTMASGSQAYYSCNNIVNTGGTWYYFYVCTGTVSSGTIKTVNNNVVAEAYSNDVNKVSACSGRDGWLCNVYPAFGFRTDTALNYVGYCDSSSQNCVKCSGKLENASYTGGISISGSGNGLCELGCGAISVCDEKSSSAWSNNPASTGSVFEAYCSSDCQVSQTRCRASFGAHALCDYKVPSDVCISDYCDGSNRLVDYNGNAVKDDVACTSNCGCDNVIDTTLCDTVCGASSECHRHDIGYNTVGAGCDNSCAWLSCGYYKWNSASNVCFNTCSGSSANCYNGAVCNYFTSACVVDNQPPIVTATLPVNSSMHSVSLVDYSFSVTDDADNILDCGYTLDSTNVSVGVVNHGATYSNYVNILVEGWHGVKFYCTDEAGNTGYSDRKQFLFDKTKPSYSNLNYEDLTPTCDNSLIDGDLVKISSYWSDNLYLNYTQFFSNKTGSWTVEAVKYYSGSSNGWSNFTFDTAGYGDEVISFKFVTYDFAGNSDETTPLNVHVYTPRTDISVIMREGVGNITNLLEFLGDARPLFSAKAVDSVSTVSLGDFYITHTGIGTTINNLFKLNDTLPSGVQIKISSSNNPATSTYLDNNFVNAGFCNNMIPGNTCQVWVWIDLNEAVPPVKEDYSIEIESELI
ncbi:Uncharacterised protein [Candidatus Tiddalikarchaeum anstoanum]|nr:Uncharacterised protein [Candidatus Tiddalikarchaeum anstoanum]